LDSAVCEAVDRLLAETGARFRCAVDLGCGYGQYGWMLKRHVGWLIGVDKDRHRLSEAVLHDYDEVVAADIREYRLPEEAEAVFLFDVVEHLSKDDGHRLLRRLRGLSVILTTPARFRSLAMDRHVSLWTPGELKKLGFTVSPVDYSNPFTGLLYGWCILAYRFHL